MTIDGVGTDSLIVKFIEGETRPSSITLTVTLANAPSTEFDVQVADGLHGRELEYYIEVPEE